jgi:glucose-6-phosphate isomerase
MLHKNNIPLVRDLIDADPDRGRHFSLQQGGWWLDYSRLPLNRDQRKTLLRLPDEHEMSLAVERLFGGEKVNTSEDQAALHMALRAARPGDFPGADVDQTLLNQRQRFLTEAGRLHRGELPVTDLLHIGIGGSDLGPRLVTDALDEDDGRVRVHWLSTLDGRRFDRLLNRLDRQTTAIMVASKSFSTEETLTQAQAARDWLGDGFVKRSWAATANAERAIAFGLDPERILPFPAWTGGRFSLWSSVGFSAAARIGPQRFTELLAGAAQADSCFAQDNGQGNLAVMMALVMHFLRRELDLPTLGVVAYEPRLALLGDFLQQLIMESLGKGVDLDDQPLDQPTTPLIFGGRGTDLQHSIFQALHQGLDSHPLLLVGTLEDQHAWPDWHQAQLAHLLAQAAAFAHGRDDGRPCQHLPGNRPVSVLLAQRLTPQRLGFLLASFEHAVYALSVLWNINPFDQWGVEEGKRLASQFRKRLKAAGTSLDEISKL